MAASRHIQRSDIGKKYNFLNPKAGVTYSFNNARLYASYSYAAKEPNRDDFEAGILHQPKPEKMQDVEAGAEIKHGTWGWSANIFYMKYKDQLIPTGKINDVGAYTRINIPNSYRLGIELQGNVSPAKWIGLSANLALSRNKVIDYTEYYDDYDNGGQKSAFYSLSDIAFSPAVVGGASVNIYPFKNAAINFSGKYVSRQYLDNSSKKSRSLDPYYVQDARMSYTLHNKIFKETNLIFQVNNLFNEKYEANGYTYSYQSGGSLITDNYYFPMAPTNVMFAVNITL